MRMYNPPHPGEVIREYLGEMNVSAAAKHLGVSRVTFSRVLNGKAAVSPEMAIRLAPTFSTTNEERNIWLATSKNFAQRWTRNAAPAWRSVCGKLSKSCLLKG